MGTDGLGDMGDDWGFLTAEGTVAAEMRAVDWAATPVGPPGGWPPALRQALATMLSASQGMFLAWGPELTFFFNDAYRPHLGARAPGALGRRFQDLWFDIWADIEPIVHRALAGEGQRFEDFPLTMTRNGFAEETWWTFSYDPLRDEEGAIRGMWCVALDASARVLAERHARAERERLAGMFENAPGFFALLEGPDHRFAAANPAYLRLVGGREVLGRAVAEALPEPAARGFLGQLDRVRGSGEPLAEQGARMLRPGPGGEPEERFLDLVYQPTRDAEGAPAGIFVAGHDVTEAHRAAAVLRESEGRFRTLFESLDESVVILERRPGADGRSDYRYVTLNRAAREALDLEGAEGESARLRRPDAEEEWYALFDRVVATREPQRVERQSKRTGRIMEVFLAPMGDAAEERILTVTRDVTERRAAESALREANATLERRVSQRTAELRLLANIVETTDAFIQVVDPGFRWLGINRAAADECLRVYGTRPRVGDSMIELLAGHPEALAALRSLWSRALAGTAFTEIAELGDPGLDRRTYEMKFDGRRDRDGRVTAAPQIATDVTERIRSAERLAEAEDQLRQAQKMEAIGQLTGGVAHDFNNLLTPIVGALDLLQRRAAGTPREQRLIEGAMQSAERARTLVSRLLAFARRQPLEVRPVDLAKLVEGLRNLVVSTVGPQVRVDVHVGSDLPPAVVDANQLEMAILNLAVNARDAMPQGGTLTVAAAREEVGAGTAGEGRGGQAQGLAPGTYLRLWVEDTGSGMDEGVLARAAEPFFSTKGTGKGTGLGLSMVHGLAMQLGGALGLESEPGRGTRVTLWLPAGRRGVQPGPARPRAVPAPGPRGAALLVDDEALVREATADMLHELGWRVTPAASGEEALRLVAEGLAPDLLVTDHLMPGMTGTDLALRLRTFWPDLPVLIVSGFAEGSGLSPDLPRLPKPFRRDELAASLQQARRA